MEFLADVLQRIPTASDCEIEHASETETANGFDVALERCLNLEKGS